MRGWKTFMMCLVVLALMALPLLGCGDGGTEYDLTMAISGNGSTTPEAGSQAYDEDEVVDITATPDSGWVFVSWTGDVADSDSASTTVTMDADKEVTANFAKAFTLTMAADGDGSTDPAAGDHIYAEGTIVDITATADSGSVFVSWTGDVADSDSASTTVTMDEAKTVTANFAQAFTLTMAVDGDGSTNPAAGDHIYAAGTVVDIAATADTSNSFNEWIGDVHDAVDPDDGTASAKVTMDADKTVTAVFSLESWPSVTMIAPSNGDTVSGMVHIEATLTDNKWVSEAGFTVDILSQENAVNISMDPPEGGPTVTATYEWDSTTVANGEHTMWVLARDNLGTGFVGPQVTVTVSNQVLLSIDSPSNGDDVSGTVTIEASANSDAGITGGEYSIDGGTAVAMTMDPSGGGTSVTLTADWDSTPLSEGDHTIAVTAENADGVNNTKTVTVRINNVLDAWGYETTYADPLLTTNGYDNPEIRHWTLNDEGVQHMVIGLDPTSIIGEAVGTGDGTTVDFNLANGLVVTNTDAVSVGGTPLTRDVDYTIDLDVGQIHFTAAPAVDDEILISYTYYNDTWEGDCKLMDYVLPPAEIGNFADGQILFKGPAMAVLTVQSDCYDVVTGHKMYTTGAILLFGSSEITAYQSYEWTDDTHYIMYTLMVPPAGPSLNEKHHLEAGTPETIVTAAGTYVCDVTLDYIDEKETTQDTDVYGDPTDAWGNPSSVPILMRTEWRDSASPSDGLIKFEISSYNEPMTALLESLDYSP